MRATLRAPATLSRLRRAASSGAGGGPEAPKTSGLGRAVAVVAVAGAAGAGGYVLGRQEAPKPAPAPVAATSQEPLPAREAKKAAAPAPAPVAEAEKATSPVASAAPAAAVTAQASDAQTAAAPAASTAAEPSKVDASPQQPSPEDVQSSADVEAQVAAAVAAAAAEAAEARKAAEASQAAEISEAARAALRKVEEGRERGMRLCEEAAAELKAALAEAQVPAVAAALAKAKVAGVLGADISLAESIISTPGPDEAEVNDLLQIPEDFRSLDPAAAAAEERKRSEGLDRQALEARVVELTKHLALARLHSKARLEQALQTRLTKAELQSLQSLYTGLQAAEAEFDQASAKELAELKSNLRREHEEEVAKAVEAARAEAKEQLEAEREQLVAMAEDAKLEEQTDRLEEVMKLHRGLAKLEMTLKKDDEVVKRAQAYNSLSASLLGLEDALLSDRSASGELENLQKAAAEAGDEFVAELVKSIPPSSVELVSRPQPMPTEPTLQHSLKTKIDDFAAAALVPPSSGLLGALLGQVFRRLYILDGQSLEMPQESPAARDLRLLGRAAASGKVREAVPCLLAVRGSARCHVEAFAEDVQAVLRLRQILSAVKARVQCLNASLL